MFESAEIPHAVSKKVFEEQKPLLREALLEAQFELAQQKRFSVLILINGIEGAGKEEAVKLLSEWLDPRFLRVEALGSPNDEERARPPAWRYWRRLPPKGLIGIMLGNWYSQMLITRINGLRSKARHEQDIHSAERAERMLNDEGVLIFKFWLHLSADQLKSRLKAALSNPLYKWGMQQLDWKKPSTYKKFVRLSETMLRRTSRDYAPWYVISGADDNYRSLSVGRILLEGLQAALKNEERRQRQPHAAPLVSSIDNTRLIGSLDMTLTLGADQYKKQLAYEQARLAGLMRDKGMARHSVMMVFEGNDAAGKGGAVRRVTEALDPRQYKVVPIAAPTEEERAQPYLWRFWRHVPALGNITVFDRSWYGRVLVERVEGFCSQADWLRAYGEINDFEESLVDAGVILVKFWMAIDSETQLQRFKEREQIGFKRYKITAEDWRNRERWNEYVDAVGDMIDRTSTTISPWTLVEANDKRYARVKVLRTINDRIFAALGKA
jgi:polyphosphate:AMP phosphotransferase